MDNFDRLIRFDSIRLFKILEIIYYTLLSFIITLIIANLLDDKDVASFIFKKYDFEKANILKLFIDIIIDLIFLVLLMYYLKKLLNCIPFVFASLNKKYKPSMKDEVNIGIGIGSGIILYVSLETIKLKLKVLDKKLKSYINILKS